MPRRRIHVEIGLVLNKDTAVWLWKALLRFTFNDVYLCVAVWQREIVSSTTRTIFDAVYRTGIRNSIDRAVSSSVKAAVVAGVYVHVVPLLLFP